MSQLVRKYGDATMNYYISDLHLFHATSIQFDDRPFADLEEMHKVMVEKWNRKVTNGDTVYILGDLSLRGTNKKLISLVATLKGKKVLVSGNHDDVTDYRYRQLFAEICNYKEIHDSVNGKNYSLVLCHYPIFSWRNMGRGAILLYGHTHCSPEDAYFKKCLTEMVTNDCRHTYNTTVRACNVGCMQPWMNYEPRSLRELLEWK